MDLVLSLLSSIIQLIGLILFKFYGWVVVVAVLGYLIWQNRRREVWVNGSEYTLLKIGVPRENEKKELSAEQMFASLHGILRSAEELAKDGALQDHLSFEIASIKNQIQFYVWTPKHLKDFVVGQIYAQYPSVHIEEDAVDYTTPEPGQNHSLGTELKLVKNEVLPIKVFASFEVDPLAGITAVMAKLDQQSEEMWVQILARPTDDAWRDRGLKYIDELKSGKKTSIMDQLIKMLIDLPMHVLSNLFSGLATPPEAKKEEKKEEKKELSIGQASLAKGAEEKINKLGFEIKIRIAYMGPDETLAKQRIQAIVGGFKQFNTNNLNGFTSSGMNTTQSFIDDYRARLFLDDGYVLNIEELAGLYHLPHKSVETPNLAWATSKNAEPPFTLPGEGSVPDAELSLIGLTNFRGHQIKFGIKRADRGRHLYIIGQTGTGKSFLLQLLMLSDLYHNVGMAVVDPHGDLATDIMRYIPEHRLKDVVYFNPADRDFPIAFNPMEVTDPNFKNMISSELVGVLKRLFESWGPRLEYILRFTILALLDYPNATMLGITRMLTEKNFRNRVIKQIKDPIVKNFWVTEFASWNDKFASEAVAPVLNKVGAFTANPLVRNIIGQPKSGVNLRKIMDEGKILVVNLSTGLVGEDNAGILGALMVTKIQLAAMSRADIVDKNMRRPFYLYVDEFQNFATDSFAVILSEARKYGLNLTVANQYVSQMPETVRDAVFGNVGSMISMRVGAADGTILGKYFEPTFLANDLITLNNQNCLISMSIDGEKTTPFSAVTLRMPTPSADHTDQIIALTREKFASSRAEVEDKIAKWTEGADDQAESGEPADGAAADPTDKPNLLITEQKPNNPFLAGLKNPEAGSIPAPTISENRGGQGSNRPVSKNVNDVYRPAEHRRENTPSNAPAPATSYVEDRSQAAAAVPTQAAPQYIEQVPTQQPTSTPFLHNADELALIEATRRAIANLPTLESPLNAPQQPVAAGNIHDGQSTNLR